MFTITVYYIIVFFVIVNNYFTLLFTHEHFIFTCLMAYNNHGKEIEVTCLMAYNKH